MKQKKQIIALAILAVVALLVWRYESQSPQPTVQTLAAIQSYQVLAEQDSTLHRGNLNRAQETEYKSNGRNPFSPVAPPPPEDRNHPKAIDPPKPITPEPTPAPTVAAFPANLKYFGYGIVPNGTIRRAFFTDGEDVYVVTEGETLLGRYRILKVGNTNLEFQEISSGLRGTAPLEEQSVPPAA